MLVERPSLLLLAAGAVVAAYVATLAMQQVTILYGKRLFATVVLLALFFQTTSFLAFAPQGGALEHATLGLVVPGLIAYQLLRQPVKATLVATAAVTALTFSLVLIFAKLNLITGQQAGRLDIGAVFDEYALEVLLAWAVAFLGAWFLRRTRFETISEDPFAAPAVAAVPEAAPEVPRPALKLINGGRSDAEPSVPEEDAAGVPLDPPLPAMDPPAPAAEAAYRGRGLPKRALLVGLALVVAARAQASRAS